jgi:hypothetical protein
VIDYIGKKGILIYIWFQSLLFGEGLRLNSLKNQESNLLFIGKDIHFDLGKKGNKLQRIIVPIVSFQLFCKD